MTASLDKSQVYLAFMQEIKWRFQHTVERLGSIRANPQAAHHILDAELCYLQVRFICELIALASLSAHHEFGLNKDLLKAWNADDIFTRLEAINPFCFPAPVKLTVDGDGNKQFSHAPERDLSREALCEIYGQCGDALHRGRLKHMLASKTKYYELDRLDASMQSIWALLAEHLILFPTTGKALLVNITGPGDEVVVIEAESEAGGPVHVSSDPVSSRAAKRKPRRPHKEHR
jgi:hypothetical protein